MKGIKIIKERSHGAKEIGSPGWFIDPVDGMAKIIHEITPKRRPALYGSFAPVKELRRGWDLIC